jgi:hypothetical protein
MALYPSVGAFMHRSVTKHALHLASCHSSWDTQASVRIRMAQYEVKKAEAEAKAEGEQDGMDKCTDRTDDRSVRDSSVVDTTL